MWTAMGNRLLPLEITRVSIGIALGYSCENFEAYQLPLELIGLGGMNQENHDACALAGGRILGIPDAIFLPVVNG